MMEDTDHHNNGVTDNVLNYQQKIDYLQKWFEENNNLPNKIDPLLLRRFYQCMKQDVEATKKLIEMNYSIRNAHPNIFLMRDPNDEDSRLTFEYADMVPLPGLTEDNCKMMLFHLADANPSKVRHIEDTKAFIMLTDCRLSIPDIDVNNGSSTELSIQPILASAEIHIFDMTGYTIKHAMRLSISTMRIYTKFLEQAYPLHIKGIHMIHCPSYLDKLLAIVRPFINKEVYKLIHFHNDGLEDLYKYVLRDLLPEEYGGSAGPLKKLKEQFMEIMLSKRNYLMDPDYWKV